MKLDHDSPELEESWGQDFLVFSLGGQEYGIDFLKVRETYDYGSQNVASLAHAPAYVDGVMSLGALSIPVVDLRARLGLAPRDPVLPARLVLLDTDQCALGVVVDHVDGMLILQSWQIGPEVQTADGPAKPCVTGTGTAGTRVLTLLDADALLPREVALQVEQALA
jgi:purine-binding chemotaxis protein CheW